MEWVPVTDYENGIDFTDIPRKLTNDEIKYICSHLPLAPSADSHAAQVARQGVIEWMMETLREVFISPSAIPELIQRIIEQHKKSLVVPGTPVGITAAEAVGATTTQMTLNSVAPWEKILIQDMEGESKLFEIGKWIDELILHGASNVQHIPENRTEYLELDNPVYIITPNSKGDLSWGKVTAVTRHYPVGDLVLVKTKSGRNATVTQSKSLLIWDEDKNKLVSREGNKVKIGDLIPIISQAPEPSKVEYSVDLRKFFSPKEWLYGSELVKLYKDYDECKFREIEPKLNNLPFTYNNSELKACREALDTDSIKSGFIYPKHWKESVNTKIPEIFQLDKQFGQIVGLYLGGGIAMEDRVFLNVSAPEIKDLVSEWCDKHGLYYNEIISGSIRICSVLLSRWFEDWLGGNISEKSMPHEILFGNREFIIGILDGFFAAAGNITNGELSITSSDKELIEGFSFLCSRLGIFGKKSMKKEYTNYGVSVYSFSYKMKYNNANIWKELIGSCHNEKNRLMNLDGKRNKEWGSRSDVTTRETEGCSGQGPRPKVARGSYYRKYGDIMLDPIVSIEFIPATEYVYDLTIPSTKNFSLWNGFCTRDTFHTSGSAKSASFGIEAMRDLIFARKKPKNESSTIYFTDKSVTYEQVLNSRRYIVGSVIRDFVRDYEIDSPENIDINSKKYRNRYWWHDKSELLLGKQIPNSTKVLRLYLNTVEMFKHKVSISELASVFEREIPPSAVAIYGPISDGIIDIYPHPGIISETLKGKYKEVIPPDLAEITYLETIIVPEMSNIRVKGISGIRQLYPLISPVWRMVLLERKINNSDIISEETRRVFEGIIDNGWFLFYNIDIMKTTGIIPNNLAALCQLAGIEIIAGTSDRLIIGMPNDRFRTNFGDIVYKIDGEMYREIKPEAIIEFEDVRFKEVDDMLFTKTSNGWDEVIDEINNNKVVIALPEDSVRKINNKTYKVIDESLIIIINDQIFERIISVDDKTIKINELKPSDYVSFKVKTDKDWVKSEIDRLTRENIAEAEELPENERKIKLRKPITVPPTPLMNASEFVIAETDGSNLKELLALPGIDKTRTTCNNMYTIAETLGIEAARTFLIRALNNTIANTGSYVHPANIMFIAEFITSRGEPYGATYTGISRQPGGHLSLATIERAGETFRKSALHGREDDIRNVSTAIAMGARMAIGSGSFDIAMDITTNGIKHTVINDDLFTALEKDDSTIELLSQQQQQEANLETISPDDFLESLNSLKTITVGGTFDYTSGENESTLLTLFNRGEIIPERTYRTPTQPTVPNKFVRRVQQSSESRIDPELTDIFTNIKFGVPIDDSIEPFRITPLQTGVSIQQSSLPIISSALVQPEQFDIIGTDTGIPFDLQALIDQYITSSLPQGIPNITTVVTDLPSVDIPELPDISDLVLGRDLIDLRREQVRDLQPIDINTLQSNLNANQ